MENKTSFSVEDQDISICLDQVVDHNGDFNQVEAHMIVTVDEEKFNLVYQQADSANGQYGPQDYVELCYECDDQKEDLKDYLLVCFDENEEKAEACFDEIDGQASLIANEERDAYLATEEEEEEEPLLTSVFGSEEWSFNERTYGPIVFGNEIQTWSDGNIYAVVNANDGELDRQIRPIFFNDIEDLNKWMKSNYRKDDGSFLQNNDANVVLVAAKRFVTQSEY